jgi:hypothetical protein
MPALLDDTSHGVLLKEQLTSALKQVIVTGRFREGNPFPAGQRLQHCTRPFAASAYAVCKSGERSIEAHHNGQRPRGREG